MRRHGPHPKFEVRISHRQEFCQVGKILIQDEIFKEQGFKLLVRLQLIQDLTELMVFGKRRLSRGFLVQRGAESWNKGGFVIPPIHLLLCVRAKLILVDGSRYGKRMQIWTGSKFIQNPRQGHFRFLKRHLVIELVERINITISEMGVKMYRLKGFLTGTYQGWDGGIQNDNWSEKQVGNRSFIFRETCASCTQEL